MNIESQIGEFNEMLLKRDKLISNSSSKNPVVQDLNNSLIAMKQTIIRSVDNLIVGLNIKIKNIRAQEEQTSRRISLCRPSRRRPFGGTPPEDQRGTVSLPVEQA